MSAWDKGKSAARQGLSRQSNPYNHPDRQPSGSMAWEQKASEWDEGFDGFDPEQDAQDRINRARKAAAARWKNKSDRKGQRD